MLSEQGKGEGAIGKIPFVRTLAGAGKIAGQTLGLPLAGFVSASNEKGEKSLFKQLGAQSGKLFRTGAKAVKVAYAYAVAPKHVRNAIKKLWRAWPNLKIRLMNIWVLIYPDMHNPNTYSVVYYAPDGSKLVQTSVSKEEAEEMKVQPETAGAKAIRKIEGGNKAKKKIVGNKAKKKIVGNKAIKKIEGGNKAKTEAEDIKIEIRSMGMEYDQLDMIEEEIMNEALGLPPAAALLARWKYGKSATLVRYRIWILQFFDSARNKTFISIYDALPQKLEPGEELNPIHKFAYQGKQEMI